MYDQWWFGDWWVAGGILAAIFVNSVFNMFLGVILSLTYLSGTYSLPLSLSLSLSRCLSELLSLSLSLSLSLFPLLSLSLCLPSTNPLFLSLSTQWARSTPLEC